MEVVGDYVGEEDVDLPEPETDRTEFVTGQVTNLRVAPSGQAMDPWDEEEHEELAELWATAYGFAFGVVLALVARARRRGKKR